jgi:hypothetical protein
MDLYVKMPTLIEPSSIGYAFLLLKKDSRVNLFQGPKTCQSQAYRVLILAQGAAEVNLL